MATTLATLLVAAGSSGGAAPSPGAPGIGDPLQRRLGNGGYDVLHYDLRLRYATSDPMAPIEGDETITARATQALSRFDLDWAGDSIGGVSVNGAAARFAKKGQELVITPAAPLLKGSQFTVGVTDFTATPTPISSKLSSTALFFSPNGTAMAAQPYYTHLVFPCNDHPRDLASFSLALDVPAGDEAVANGVRTGHVTAGGRSTWTYEMEQPMATELVQAAAGDWDFTTPYEHAGVVIRDVTAPSLTATMQQALALEPAQLDYLQTRVGPYPFDEYGILVVDADVGFALETQTLSEFPGNTFTDYGQGVWDPSMLHELAHQWFGDSVAPYAWTDLWLNEGHASWYEFTYAQSTGQLAEDTTYYPDPHGYATLEGLMRAVYAHGDQWRHDFGPVAMPASGDASFTGMYSYQVYHGGALALYALRQKVGTPAFKRIERAWVERYAGMAASTEDFIALASEVSGKHLNAFLRNWLYGTTTPPMPGHPDWTADPVVPGPPPATATAPARTALGLRS